jgi:hypothetical protein
MRSRPVLARSGSWSLVDNFVPLATPSLSHGNTKLAAGLTNLVVAYPRHKTGWVGRKRRFPTQRLDTVGWSGSSNLSRRFFQYSAHHLYGSAFAEV